MLQLLAVEPLYQYTYRSGVPDKPRTSQPQADNLLIVFPRRRKRWLTHQSPLFFCGVCRCGECDKLLIHRENGRVGSESEIGRVSSPGNIDEERGYYHG